MSVVDEIKKTYIDWHDFQTKIQNGKLNLVRHDKFFYKKTTTYFFYYPQNLLYEIYRIVFGYLETLLTPYVGI